MFVRSLVFPSPPSLLVDCRPVVHSLVRPSPAPHPHPRPHNVSAAPPCRRGLMTIAHRRPLTSLRPLCPSRYRPTSSRIWVPSLTHRGPTLHSASLGRGLRSLSPTDSDGLRVVALDARFFLVIHRDCISLCWNNPSLVDRCVRLSLCRAPRLHLAHLQVPGRSSSSCLHTYVPSGPHTYISHLLVARIARPRLGVSYSVYIVRRALLMTSILTPLSWSRD